MYGEGGIFSLGDKFDDEEDSSERLVHIWWLPENKNRVHGCNAIKQNIIWIFSNFSANTMWMFHSPEW